MILVTTTRFTDAAVEYAQSIPTPVELIDGNKLEQIIQRFTEQTSLLNERREEDDRLGDDLSWDDISRYYPPDVTPCNNTRCSNEI